MTDSPIYLSNRVYDIMKNFSISSSQTLYYKPTPTQETDLGEWKRSLRYDKTQVDNLIREILVDFGAEPSRENMDWIKKEVTELISVYEKNSHF
jgi:hypothetical protein